MRKPDFCLCENKVADQLHSNCEADQRLCFRYKDSTIPLLHKTKISSLPPSGTVQAGLCYTRSQTLKTCFLQTRLRNYISHKIQILQVQKVTLFCSFFRIQQISFRQFQSKTLVITDRFFLLICLFCGLPTFFLLC